MVMARIRHLLDEACAEVAHYQARNQRWRALRAKLDACLGTTEQQIAAQERWLEWSRVMTKQHWDIDTIVSKTAKQWGLLSRVGQAALAMTIGQLGWIGATVEEFIPVLWHWLGIAPPPREVESKLRGWGTRPPTGQNGRRKKQ